MIVLITILGYALGVFINAVANSLPFSRRIERPHCLACGGPRNLIAWSGVSAWASGNRRCVYCGRGIIFRELIVELIMIAAAVLLFFFDDPGIHMLRDLIAVSIFMLIAVIDLEHRLILHMVSVPAALYFAVVGSLDTSLGLSRTALGGLVGFFFFLLLYIFGGVFARWMGRRRGEEIDEVAFGFGDVMLALVIGLAVGFPGVIWALLQGILLAGVFSFLFMVVMALRKRYEAFTPIPYGPFLILGALLVYFLGDPYSARFLGL
jgi:leader peptidase (prepilin peptidase)/N-methyltransferase